MVNKDKCMKQLVCYTDRVRALKNRHSHLRTRLNDDRPSILICARGIGVSVARRRHHCG